MIDFHHIATRHDEIDRRLREWARVCVCARNHRNHRNIVTNRTRYRFQGYSNEKSSKPAVTGYGDAIKAIDTEATCR